MEPALERRALSIVDEAMQFDGTDRSDFVRRACGDDGELRREVETILKYDNGVSIAPAVADHSPIELPDTTDSADRYDLKEEIARGGMGIVFHAYDRLLCREVAVKVVLAEHADNSELLKRFLSEAQIGACLQHPGIAPVYDLGRLADGRPFFAMKLVRGETLSAILAKRGNQAAERSRLLSIFEQLCQTVAYAHSHQIIHRDLKPANVMVGQFGEVQVMDWGLAKELERYDSLDDPELAAFRAAFESSSVTEAKTGSDSRCSVDTRFGVAMGTPAYMPPEQTVGLRDETTDVFALGAILCEILTGQPPYTAPTPTEVHVKSAQGRTDEALARLEHCECDAELVELVRKCLATSPAERWPDAEQVACHFTQYLETTQSRLRTAEIVAAQAEAEARGERKRQRLVVGLALAGLTIFALVAGGWAWLSQKQATRLQEIAAEQWRRSVEINGALEAAKKQYDIAEAAPIRDLAPWIEARAAVARAEALVQTESVDEQLIEEVARVRSVIDDGEAQRTFVLAIDKARDLTLVIPDHTRSQGEILRDGLAETFLMEGVHPDASTPAEAVERLDALSPAVRAEVIGGLDQWLIFAAPHRKWLLEVLRIVDNEPWRNSWRDAYIAGDREALVAMFLGPELADQSARSILNVAESLTPHLPADDRIAVLQRLQVRHVGDFWFNARLGTMLWEEKRSLDALSYFSAAAAIRQGGHLLRVLGDILYAAGRYDEALVHLRRAVELNPDVYDQWEYLGETLANLGRHDEAIQAFEGALQRNPDSAYSMGKLGDNLRAAGRADESLAILRKATGMYPNDMWMQIYLGLSLRSTGQIVESTRVFERLREHADNDDYGTRIRQESQGILQAALSAIDSHTPLADAVKQDDVAYLCDQSLHWLRFRIDHGLAGELQAVLDDPRLAIVRDESRLATLPPHEQTAWREFWDGMKSQAARDASHREHVTRCVAASNWHVLKLNGMISSAGAQLDQQADGSVLVSGDHQPNDLYTLVAKIGPMTVAALKLEVLADPSLPNNGPGRHETGNFQLAEVTVEVSDESTPTQAPLTFAGAWASYAWKDRPVERVIDGDTNTAWHVWGRLGQSHVAVVFLETPLVITNPDELKVALQHGGDLGPGIGRFRLSVSPDNWSGSLGD